MEYEIYYLCNLLGLILVIIIILFHFVDADNTNKDTIKQKDSRKDVTGADIKSTTSRQDNIR
jgi:hypothetical protein